VSDALSLRAAPAPYFLVSLDTAVAEIKLELAKALYILLLAARSSHPAIRELGLRIE
jgi:hypothetical protein